MTPERAAKNWKMATAGLFAVVIILLLLWRKPGSTQSGDVTIGGVTIGLPDLGDINWPDIIIQVTGGGGNDGQPSTPCGCTGDVPEAFNDLMAYFVNGMRSLQDQYNAAILGSLPGWTDQYLNNYAGYNLSQTSTAFFGAFNTPGVNQDPMARLAYQPVRR